MSRKSLMFAALILLLVAVIAALELWRIASDRDGAATPPGVRLPWNAKADGHVIAPDGEVVGLAYIRTPGALGRDYLWIVTGMGEGEQIIAEGFVIDADSWRDSLSWTGEREMTVQFLAGGGTVDRVVVFPARIDE